MRRVFRRVSVVVVALMLGFATGPVRADILYGGEYLDEDFGLYGGDGYRLEYSGNGFLKYGRYSFGQPYELVWFSSCDSESSGGCASGYGNHIPQQDPGDFAVMQTDGNFVMYAYRVPGPGYNAVWATNTEGNANAFLNAQSDANLVVYSQSNVPLWSIW